MSAPDLPARWPRVAEDELSTLHGFVDYFRRTLQRQCAGLDREQLARRLPGDHPSTLTLGGLLKHLAFVEDHWFGFVLLGRDRMPPFDAVDWARDPDWDFHSAAEDDPDDLRRLLTAAIERSDAALDGVDDLAMLSARKRHGRQVSVRWILVHMVEEYARHCGHADLLREAVDGATAL